MDAAISSEHSYRPGAPLPAIQVLAVKTRLQLVKSTWMMHKIAEVTTIWISPLLSEMPQSCGVENEAQVVINTFLSATHAHPLASGPQHASTSARDNIAKRRFVSQTAGARHLNRFFGGGMHNAGRSSRLCGKGLRRGSASYSRPSHATRGLLPLERTGSLGR